jgi:hypothetical protein
VLGKYIRGVGKIAIITITTIHFSTTVGNIIAASVGHNTNTSHRSDALQPAAVSKAQHSINQEQ